jgi:hypothetical protein
VLVLASALLDDVWRWLNPWDTLARVLGGVAPDDPDPAPEPDARWALPAAVAWVWYLHLYGQSLSPRAVGAALAAYTIVTVSGCLAVGRRRWFARAEVFTLLFGWVARIRRGGLLAWTPPRGADLVLGVLAGGALFTMVRISDLWRPLGQGTRPQLWAVVGLVACCAGAAGLLRLLERRARRLGSAGAVAAAAVPTVAALTVAVGLSRSRLPSAAQLLVVLAGDPFGRGWDLFGTAGLPVHPNPLTTTGLVLTQVLVLCAGGVASAVIARRRSEPGGGRSTTRNGARPPALIPVCVLVGMGVLAVTAI